MQRDAYPYRSLDQRELDRRIAEKIEWVADLEALKEAGTITPYQRMGLWLTREHLGDYRAEKSRRDFFAARAIVSKSLLTAPEHVSEYGAMIRDWLEVCDRVSWASFKAVHSYYAR